MHKLDITSYAEMRQDAPARFDGFHDLSPLSCEIQFLLFLSPDSNRLNNLLKLASLSSDMSDIVKGVYKSLCKHVMTC